MVAIERYDPVDALFHLELIMASLSIPDDDYVIFGSMPMWFHGLRDGVGDIDVFVRESAYEKLKADEDMIEVIPDPNDPPYLEYSLVKPNIHFFYDWTGKSNAMDMEQCFKEAEVSGGWRFAPLEEVFKWKSEALREKDIEDLVRIKEYWEGDKSGHGIQV
jgi:hypothetical protein